MVGEETISFPEFCPTRGGHGVGGVRGGWYMNLGAQSLQILGKSQVHFRPISGISQENHMRTGNIARDV